MKEEIKANKEPIIRYKDHRKRLYNKILNCYKDMTDREILEVMLFAAHMRKDTKPIATDLLRKCGSLAAVISADEHTLKRVDGVGIASIAVLKTMKYACEHIVKENVKNNENVMTSWAQMIEFFRVKIGHEKEENILIVFMNTNRKMLGYKIYQGTINKIIVYPREIVRIGLELGSSVIILVHNHPNDYSRPSQADINMTIKLKKILAEIDIELYDHVIITTSEYFSFKEGNLL